MDRNGDRRTSPKRGQRTLVYQPTFTGIPKGTAERKTNPTDEIPDCSGQNQVRVLDLDDGVVAYIRHANLCWLVQECTTSFVLQAYKVS